MPYFQLIHKGRVWSVEEHEAMPVTHPDFEWVACDEAIAAAHCDRTFAEPAAAVTP